MKKLKLLGAGAGMVVVIFALGGCGMQNPEDSPVIKDVIEQVEANTEFIQVNSDMLRGISKDINTIQDDISRVKTLTAGTTAHEQKIAELEKRLAAVEKSLDVLKKATPTRGTVSREMPSEKITKKEAFTEPKGYYYTIKKGDNISVIAKSAGVSASNILKANDLAPEATIFPGNMLFIPHPDAK